jgi:nicotinic acid phosphoribosyltransferase
MIRQKETTVMRTLFFLATLAVIQIPSALAQNAPACDGNVTIVRIDSIKPGKMSDFLAAVQAHQAWYKSHGYDDQIFAAKIMVRDEKSKEVKYSDSEVITYHIQSTHEAPKHDAAWDAYVKQYDDSSKVKATYITCSPKM